MTVSPDEQAKIEAEIARLFDYLLAKFRETQTDPPPLLWHYTTAEGLLGIAGNKKLWMNHVTCMNDSREYDHTLTHLIDAVGRRVRSVAVRPSHIETFHSGLIGPLINMMILKNMPSIFVSCLTAKSDTLPHWIEYGRHGLGYAVGFDGPKLKAKLPEGVTLTKCIYDSGVTAAFMDDLLVAADDAWTRILDGCGHHRAAGLIDGFISDFVSAAAWLGPLFKHSAFEHEAEWRLVIFHFHDELGREFRAKENEVREIVHMPFDADCIAEIKIGSNRDERLREMSALVIERMARAYGLGHVKVSESLSPYRSP